MIETLTNRSQLQGKYQIFGFAIFITFLFPLHGLEAAGNSKGSKLQPPSGVVAESVPEFAIQLSWNDTNSSEEGYRLERRLSGKKSNKYAIIANVGANTTAYEDGGLSEGVTYEYRIKAIKQPNRLSSDYSETVSATPIDGNINEDTEPPAVVLTQPLDGANFASDQTVTVIADATDNVGVSMVEFYDNGLLVHSDANAPFQYDWTVNDGENGTHNLSAKAFDAAGNSADSSVVQTTVDIDSTPPSVSITSPSTGTAYTNAQTVVLDVSASDNKEVAKVDFYRNGTLQATDTTAPFNHEWAFDDADNDSYEWVAKASDFAGNETDSAVVQLTVDIDTTINSGDIIIDQGFLGPYSSLNIKGRMAEFGEISALLYDNILNDTWLYLWDQAGNESWVALPDLNDNQMENGEYVLTGPDEFWVFSSDGSAAFGESGAPAVARGYHLTGGGALPTTAVLFETRSFGDEYSSAGSFIRLKSGALLGAWYRMSETTSGGTIEDNYADVSFAYRSPDGVWSTLSSPELRVDALPNHKHRLTLAQHPADDSIWVFSKADSYREIWAIHLTEEGTGITLDWVDDRYITQELDGENGPQGERPALLAVPDPYNNQLLLAYQNANYQIFSSSPFVKGAYVSIAQIEADGSRSFLSFPTYIERVYGLGGLIVQPDALWLAYRPIDTENLSFDDVYISRYASGAWEAPQFLGTTYYATFLDGNALIQYGINRVNFAITQENYEIHLHTLE